MVGIDSLQMSAACYRAPSPRRLPCCTHLLGFAEAHPHFQPAHEELHHLVVLGLKGGAVQLEVHFPVAVDKHHGEQPQHDPHLQDDVAGAEQVVEARGLGRAEVHAAPQHGKEQQEAAANTAEGLRGGGEELQRGYIGDVMRRDQWQNVPLTPSTHYPTLQSMSPEERPTNWLRHGQATNTAHGQSRLACGRQEHPTHA